ncbi:transcription factor 7-like 1 [Thalassophryne amazonica]|uniref:transcription factor 7-like 1 n=1 Tax=Thalassophryne amazonica TaxID=390379 RepID=UPI00147161B1|nr:transcription factor 7-like 1 [Thalassophryne amazonica]
MVPPYTDAPPTCTDPPPILLCHHVSSPPSLSLPPSLPLHQSAASVPALLPRPKLTLKKTQTLSCCFFSSSAPLRLRSMASQTAAVNKILGQMWKFLSETEKEKYHRQQREESDRDYALHAEWRPTKTAKKRKSDSQTGTEGETFD